MAIDRDDFIKRFQQELKLLRNLKDRVDEAIGRAETKINQVVNEGKSVEDVFGSVPPKE